MRIYKLCPVTSIYLELGEFDIQALKAIETGEPLPIGLEYQYGPRYMEQTLRNAVFHRDNHTCRICRRSIKDGAVLHAHHMYYWRGQHGSTLDELLTVCERCHTPANHRPEGKLWGIDIDLPMLNGAAFMNTVRWYIYDVLKVQLPDDVLHMTYGAATKVTRSDICHIRKSHVNDAYAMGHFHPAIRAEEQHWQKRRRNNRILEKFYDAKIIDTRDGSIKNGSQLGCERTKRSTPRSNDSSLRKYRGERKTPGRRSIRKARYAIRPGDVIVFRNRKLVVRGMQHYGKYIAIEGQKAISVKDAFCLYHANAWKKIS